LLDVFLPDSTGFQICSQIRKNTATRSIPVIMMTGTARFPNQQAFGLERGANEYIAKPIDVVELGEMVHKYITTKKGGTTHMNRNATIFEKDDDDMTPVVHRKPVEKPSNDNLSALNSFLEHSISQNKTTAHIRQTPVQQPVQSIEPVGEDVMKISFMVPPPT